MKTKPKKCRDGFDTYIKNKNEHNRVIHKSPPFTEEQVDWMWKLWRVAWVQGKLFGVEEQKAIADNNGRRNTRPLLTYAEMKDLWNKNKGGTGRTFGVALEKYYGLRKTDTET